MPRNWLAAATDLATLAYGIGESVHSIWFSVRPTTTKRKWYKSLVFDAVKIRNGFFFLFVKRTKYTEFFFFNFSLFCLCASKSIRWKCLKFKRQREKTKYRINNNRDIDRKNMRLSWLWLESYCRFSILLTMLHAIRFWASDDSNGSGNGNAATPHYTNTLYHTVSIHICDLDIFTLFTLCPRAPLPTRICECVCETRRKCGITCNGAVGKCVRLQHE